jgi:hypothetical protein
MSTDALLRVVAAGGRLPDLRAANAARGAVNGLLLGVLSDARLRGLDESYYEGEDVYRTAEWNERGLFGWEQAAIDEHFGGASRIAVAACGGGREVLALRNAGFDAIGYEPHPGLVAYAQELLAAHGHPSCVHPAPRDSFPAGERCDGVIVGWGAYSLIHGRARRVSFLQAARERVAPGSPLLISFFQRSALSRELRLTQGLANGLRRLAGREPIELGDTLAPNRVHVFAPEQIAAEAAAAGFGLHSHGIFARPEEGPDYAMAVLRVT